MKLLIFACLALGVFGERNVIESPPSTNWGAWHNMSRCDEDHPYVHGFQLSTQSYQGAFGDDTAMNGINLFCDKIGGISSDFYIRSGMEYKGTWGSEFFCGGVATGFQMRSEAMQGAVIDDTAANNLRVFCNGKESFMVQGDGMGLGVWTTAQHCKERQAICGIATQVEAAAGRLDETALNNIKLECCDIHTPAEDCKPSNEWELVSVCENKEDSTKNCQIEKRVGVSYSQKRDPKRPHAQVIYQQLGFSLQEDLDLLKKTFRSKGKTNVEGFEWTKNDSVWAEENVIPEIFVPNSPQSILSIYQLKGECGIYAVKTHLFKQVEVKLTGETSINYLTL